VSLLAGLCRAERHPVVPDPVFFVAAVDRRTKNTASLPDALDIADLTPTTLHRELDLC
jgi:hypothetical protein